MMEKKKYIQPNVLVVLFEGNFMGLDGLSVFNKNTDGHTEFVENTETEGNMYDDARATKTNLWDED